MNPVKISIDWIILLLKFKVKYTNKKIIKSVANLSIKRKLVVENKKNTKAILLSLFSKFENIFIKE